MKFIKHYENKNVLVLGLAKSGTTTAKILKQLGANVTVNDSKKVTDSFEVKELIASGIKVICGHHPIELFNSGFDFVFKNPGIHYDNLMVQKALQQNIPVLTEVELAYEISEAPFIAITGSNGKTTSTLLIEAMLVAGGINAKSAGNIGTVACEVAKNATPDNWIIIEMSSFQLMGAKNFKPHIAVLTNFVEAHLDYHGTRENYLHAKINMIKNQTSDDFLIYNKKYPEFNSVQTSANRISFTSEPKTPEDNEITIYNDYIYFGSVPVVPLSKITLPGKHAVENIMGAVGVAKLLGIKNETIIKVLQNFTGVKHRLQFVKEIANRKFYNDSKATNTTAAITALSSFSAPIIWLAGGLDRGIDFFDLIPHLRNVKKMVLFGQSAEKIAKVADKLNIFWVKKDKMEDAVAYAFSCSNAEDVILLSPACASWDQYGSFEERGNAFIDSVNKLQ